MKLLPIIIGIAVVGGGIAAAIALSHPAKPKLQVIEEDGGFRWRYVESDGTVVAESSMTFGTAEEARTAGAQAGSVDQ